SASRTLRELADGIAACLTVTLLDGIVFARSVFEHSMNYRSVVVLGTASPVVERDEKLAALEAFTEKLLPGRWAEARQPTRKELKATAVLRLPLDEASAKIRDGGPEDGDTPDAELDVWAGHVPLVVQALEPVPDATLRPGTPVPPRLAPHPPPGPAPPPTAARASWSSSYDRDDRDEVRRLVRRRPGQGPARREAIR